MNDPIAMSWDELLLLDVIAGRLKPIRVPPDMNPLSLAIAAGLRFMFRPQAMPWNIKTAHEPRTMETTKK